MQDQGRQNAKCVGAEEENSSWDRGEQVRGLG